MGAALPGCGKEGGGRDLWYLLPGLPQGFQITLNSKPREGTPRQLHLCPRVLEAVRGRGGIKGPALQTAEGTGLLTQDGAQASETLPGERDF